MISKLAWLLALVLLSVGSGADARAANFTSGKQTAARFGVHESVLISHGQIENPFDVIATVKFVPPSGEQNSKVVHAFYDGENTWRARVFVSEIGDWKWSSTCSSDQGLDGKSGTFACVDSKLHGRLLLHPKNPRQWITENGRWFLNLSDTAYFLLCAHDGNGDPVSDDTARQYVHDDVERGITSVRCFLANRSEGFSESSEQWKAWHFADDAFDRPQLVNLQCADRRLRMLLDEFPHLAVQLIMFPLEAYARDDRFWTALTAAKRERTLRNLVARFAAYPQLFWLLTNDAHYGDSFPNSNAMVREIGAYLKQHDPWQHPRSTGHARKLPFYFGNEDWVDYIHIEHEHDLGALEYSKYRQFSKPVFLGEDRYEHDHGPKRDPAHMRYWQRRLFWAWLFSGGSTNFGGRWWTVQRYEKTGTNTATYHKRKEVTFNAPLTGLDSVTFIHDYFDQRRISLGDFEPDHALAEDADGQTGAQAPRLMRRDQTELLVYHPLAAVDAQPAQVSMNRSARLRLDLRNHSGTYSVEWFRAEDGQSQRGEIVSGGEWRELTAPWKGADIVLRLVRE